MRILIATDAWLPQGNGVVRTYQDLIPYLEAEGHTVKIIGPSDFPFRRPMPGYEEIDLCFPGTRLRRMVDEFKPDTVHIATEGPLGWTMRRLCMKRKWPFTTCYHTHFPDYVALRVQKKLGSKSYKAARAASIAIVKRFHNASSAVMTATPSLEADLTAWGVRAPLHRFTRGVNMDVFHPGPKTLFNDLVGPIALYVGRIAIEKNIPDFLDMPWAGSKVVVGSGPDLEKLRKARPDILFTGRKTGDELADHFRSADISVFPSKTDTFGIVLIEAMACGIPIAGYNVTGPMDIVSEPFLGAVDSDLGQAAQRALMAPGTAEERFAHLQRYYNWPLARDQFIAAQRSAIIPR